MKNIFKKYVALCLSATILCSLLGGFTVVADQSKSVGITARVDKTSVNAGESFTMTIGMNKFVNVVGGIQAFKFVINFDTNNFDLNDARVKEIVGRTSHSVTNYLGEVTNYTDLTVTPLPDLKQLVVVYLEHETGAVTISTDGDIFTVQFTAKAGSTSGATNFVLSSGNIETFVDCDAAMPANLRDVYPKFDATATQPIRTVSTSKEMNTFKFANPDKAGTIQANNDILVKVPFVTDLTKLVAIFSTTNNASVTVGGVTQVSGVTKNNFTNPVVYTVTADDGKTNVYTVKVNNDKSADNNITAFDFDSPKATGILNGTEIVVPVPFNSKLNNLVAVFKASDYATVKVGDVLQVSATTPNDFSHPVAYQVIAEDGTQKNYAVTVRPAQSDEKDIIDFKIGDAKGVVSEDSISVTVPYGTQLGKLVADYTSNGQSVKVGDTLQVSGTTVNDFSKSVEYTVTAQDGSIKKYTVQVDVARSDEKHIDSFKLAGVNAVISGTSINVTLPYNSSVSDLVAIFTWVGKSITVGKVDQVSNQTINSYKNPVDYLVTAQDDSSIVYTVHVTVALKSAKNFDTFKLGNTPGDIVENKAGGTIKVNMPFGTDVTKLVVDFTTAGETVWVGGVKQTPGVTANNFSKPVVFTVIAQDGSKREYTVSVVVSKATDKEIQTFSIANAKGKISGLAISVTVPYGSDLKNLVASFTFIGSTVTVGDTLQSSGITQNDFSSPVSYTVTAEDKSTSVYVVTVTVADKVVSSSSASSSTSSKNPNPHKGFTLYMIILLISLFLIVVAGILWIVFRRKK